MATAIWPLEIGEKTINQLNAISEEKIQERSRRRLPENAQTLAGIAFRAAGIGGVKTYRTLGGGGKSPRKLSLESLDF